MSTATLRPNATIASAGWSLTGAATAHAATSDDSDASKAYSTATGAGSALVFDLTDFALPFGNVVHSIAVRIRARTAAGTSLGIYQSVSGVELSIGSLTSQDVIQTISAPVTFTTPSGTPWAQADIDALQIKIVPTSLGNLNEVFEVYVDVNYGPPQPFYRGGNTVSQNGVSSLTCSRPSPAPVVGDVMLAFFTINATIFATSVPAGWSLLVDNTANGINPRQLIYWKIATAAEPASYTWQFNTTFGAGSLTIITIGEADSRVAPSVVTTDGLAASASTIPTSAGTAPADGTAFYHFSHGSTAAWNGNSPPGHTQIYSKADAATSGWNHHLTSLAVAKNASVQATDTLQSAASSRGATVILVPTPPITIIPTGITSAELFGNPTIAQTPPTDRAWLAGSSSASRSVNTVHNIPYPTGVAKDDIVVLFVQAAGSDPTWTPPAGWTRPLSGVATTQVGTDIQVFWKRYLGTEGAAEDFTSNVGVPIHFWIGAYRNAHFGGAGFGVPNSDGTSDTLWRLNSEQTYQNNAIQVAAVAANVSAATTFAAPTDWRLLYSDVDANAKTFAILDHFQQSPDWGNVVGVTTQVASTNNALSVTIYPKGGPPIYRSTVDSSTAGTATSMVNNKLTGIVEGDLLLAFVEVAAAATLSPPVGWTAVTGDYILFATPRTVNVFRKIATAADVASGQWTFFSDTAGYMMCTIVAFGGARNAVLPWTQSTISSASTSFVSDPIPAASVQANMTFVGRVGLVSNSGSVTWPDTAGDATITGVYGSNAGRHSIWTDSVNGGGGVAYPSRTATISIANTGWFAMIGLLPDTGSTTIIATGIPSDEAFGTPNVNAIQKVTPTGMATAESFGNPTVVRGPVTVTPAAIASVEAFGSPTVVPLLTYVGVTGIATSEAFGNPTVAPGKVTVLTTGMASAEAMGAPVVKYQWTLVVTGIGSSEAFGAPTIVRGPVTIGATGIASDETFGVPLMKGGPQTLTATAITSAETFGVLLVAPGPITTQPVGIVTSESFGRPNLYQAGVVQRIWQLSEGNIVPNASFEEGFNRAQWSVAGFASAIEQVGSPIMHGNSALRLYRTSAGGNRLHTALSELYGGLTPGKSYRFTSEVRASTTGHTVTMTIRFFDAAGVQVGVDQTTSSVSVSSTANTHLEIDLLVPAGTTQWQYEWDFNNVALSASDYIDNLSAAVLYEDQMGVPGASSLLSVSPVGIPSDEQMGNPNLYVFTRITTAAGFASAEAMGNPTIVLPPYVIGVSGFASAEAFGVPLLKPGTRSIVVAGLTSAEAFGNPTVLPRYTIQPTGIASAEAFGSPTILNLRQIVSVTGLASAEAMGSPTLHTGTVVVRPTGIASAEQFGTVYLVVPTLWVRGQTPYALIAVAPPFTMDVRNTTGYLRVIPTPEVEVRDTAGDIMVLPSPELEMTE